MIIDCCSQLRTYEKFFGLLGAVCCLSWLERLELTNEFSFCAAVLHPEERVHGTL